MAFIYKIINDINGKIYIGKTSLPSVEDRFKQHIADAQKDNKEKRPLYDAFSKYGVNHFHIQKIEEVQNDDIASKREYYWINKLKTYVGFQDCNGYTATLGGDGKRLYDYSQLASKYLELKNLEKTAKYFHCDIQTIRNACAECHIQIIGPIKKKIMRIGQNGQIKYYNSISDAGRDFPNKGARANISRALNQDIINPKVEHSAYGYKWKFI